MAESPTIYVKVLPTILTPDQARDEIQGLLYSSGLLWEQSCNLAEEILDKLKVVTVDHS